MVPRFRSIRLICILAWIIPIAYGGVTSRYEYSINLVDLQNDRYEVSLECEAFAADTLRFNFPWMIPGTYMEANYGQYIHDLKAYDSYGDPIKVKKDGKNTFVLLNAADLVTIEYWVSPTWTHKNLRTIYPMAGTGAIPERVFAVNAGGVFGYFEGQIRQPFTLDFSCPPDIIPMTVLDYTETRMNEFHLEVPDYHKLVDSPILLAYADTTSFMVKNTRVDIGFAHETREEPRADLLEDALSPSMQAIDSFLDSLPADRYDFLVYYADEDGLGEIIQSSHFIIPKALIYLIRNGLPMAGALEHNQSSFYYLTDPGHGLTKILDETMEDIAIHEFMHILTPLNLRSQYIDQWDYMDPELSQHLWLYEGVTEYFSKLIQVRGGLKTPLEFLQTMSTKIRNGEKFPYAKMSFTEMSANVLERKYHKQYNQVYQRGAVLGMLLDLEIIRLTDGRKDLITVINELIAEYGVNRPFDEDTFFDTFTAHVHPDLRDFFTRYMEGREALPYTESFQHVGVNYTADTTGLFPRNPIKDNKLKQNMFGAGNLIRLKKVGHKDWVGFAKGDQIDRRIYRKYYFDEFGDPLPEGTPVEFSVVRDSMDVVLHDTITYIEKERKHLLTIQSGMNMDQRRFYETWLGIKTGAESSESAAPEDLPVGE